MSRGELFDVIGRGAGVLLRRRDDQMVRGADGRYRDELPEERKYQVEFVEQRVAIAGTLAALQNLIADADSLLMLEELALDGVNEEDMEEASRRAADLANDALKYEGAQNGMGV